MYVRENWYHFLDPRVVTMIVSQQPDLQFHQAPFTWTTPASKDGLFIVLMRTESLTLWCIKKSPKKPVTLNVMSDYPETAQKVLETRKRADPFRFKYECVRNWDVPMLEGAICAFHCKVEEVIEPPTLGLTSHSLVSLCKDKTRVLATALSSRDALMFYHGTSFASACSYEVPGY